MAIAAMYLKLTGVTGESLADKHVGDIDLVSWNWGMQASHSLSAGDPRARRTMQPDHHHQAVRPRDPDAVPVPRLRTSWSVTAR